ncbi:hypothetical protein [Candidatus Berkiella aquae]|uniref:Uncharacterized protein n=1 Tax=Candidatus Berkiella aquae TaxID=295108 RepID=A0A0Q9YFQ7_9GAMM|nr:hypothetical protein [Candidatus Berkiella aquae]MCS5709824.1 hypothetical protein [Candidatus Berkiella aquae]
MNSISDTIRIANQAIENALTTTGTRKIAATNQSRIIEKQKHSSHDSSENKDMNESEENDAQATDDTSIKHIDLRI